MQRPRVIGRAIFPLPLLLVPLLLAAVATQPSPYYVMEPGGAYELESRITLPDERRQAMGRLAFTAVLVRPAVWADVARALVIREAEVLPREEALPHGMSQQEMNELNRRLIEESKLVAAMVALRAAGYSASVSGQGAEVISLIEGFPAQGTLRPGDVVVEADGQPIQTATELVEAIRRHQVGERVRLAVVRNGERVEVEVGTRNSPDEPGRPVVGAMVSTRLLGVDLPFPVEVDTGEVGGASAGLMLALGVLDALTEGLLTRGHFVGGTGTLAPDGRVGPIGGAAQKARAAERAGADVFLAPRENAAEARAAARSARVIPVDSFEEAVRALCELPPAAGAPASPPPLCGVG